jgi:hypothetical protein
MEPRGFYDVGCWSGHSSRKEARQCANDVGGYCWKVVCKDDTIKIKPVKPLSEV